MPSFFQIFFIEFPHEFQKMENAVLARQKTAFCHEWHQVETYDNFQKKEDSKWEKCLR